LYRHFFCHFEFDLNRKLFPRRKTKQKILWIKKRRFVVSEFVKTCDTLLKECLQQHIFFVTNHLKILVFFEISVKPLHSLVHIYENSNQINLSCLNFFWYYCCSYFLHQITLKNFLAYKNIDKGPHFAQFPLNLTKVPRHCILD